jgi:hypothetical protein
LFGQRAVACADNMAGRRPDCPRRRLCSALTTLEASPSASRPSNVAEMLEHPLSKAEIGYVREAEIE